MAAIVWPSTLQAARRYCSRDCFGYHIAWRLFRRTGLKGNPSWHRGFYRAALQDWTAPGGRVRVLVAGAADETVLAVLERLIGRDRLEVWLIDACPTPLLAARAYAHRTGLRLTAHRDRVPALATCQGEFDLIITDGLLSLLPDPHQRVATVRRFAQLLAADGLLLYTARIAGRTGVLEYDRLGRQVMAAAALTAWPGPACDRIHLARALRARTSRPVPFTSAGQVAACVGHEFARVRAYTRRAPHTVPLALAPSVRAGHGSISVGIAATGPRPGSSP